MSAFALSVGAVLHGQALAKHPRRRCSAHSLMQQRSRGDHNDLITATSCEAFGAQYLAGPRS
jgi:hypothetical protein